MLRAVRRTPFLIRYLTLVRLYTELHVPGDSQQLCISYNADVLQDWLTLLKLQ